MKKKVKQSAFSRYKYLLIVLATVVVLVGALLIVRYALPDSSTSDDQTVTYDPIPGEGEDQRVFPTLSMDEIQNVRIDRLSGGYAMFRGGNENEFYLAYEDKDGEMQIYYPPVADLDPTFSYSSLFATDMMGEVSVARIYNLCQAVGNIRYSERIPLSTDADERATQLATYGFTDESPKVQIWYTEVDLYGRPKEGAETYKHTITLGERVITGVGYYVMLEGRDYIYATATDTIDHVNKDYPYYISTRITPAGLSEDAAYEPYLTTGYKQWKNVWYREDGTPVIDGSRVTVSVSEWVPYALGAEIDPTSDGYIREAVRDLTFHLGNLKDQAAYSRLIAALSGQRIGAFADPIYVTLVGDGRTVTVNDGEPHTYRYEILCIESAISALDERTSGTVDDASAIKVTYHLYVDGEKKSTAPMHGVIDLSAAAVASHVDALRTLTVGETLDTPYDISILYDESNADQKVYELYLTEIISIYNQKYESIDTVGEDSIISYHYYYVIDGKKQAVQSGSLDLSKEEDKELVSLLVGKKKGELSEPERLRYQVTYLEILSDFITYEMHGIEYFVTEELIVSFRFQNASKRDPFYAESIYENRLPDDHPHSIYAMNYSTCQTLVSVLGGLGSDTTQSVGLSGLETVAVGLTPEIMEKYGLYAYTLYFELPRGIYSKSVSSPETEDEDALKESEEEMDDYAWYNTLGVKIYISELDDEGCRYVATDLYDTVVYISNESFVFLEYDFIGFWARRQPVLVNVGDVNKVEVEYNMSDLSGKLSFDLEHNPVLENESYYDKIEVNLTATDFTASAVLLEYMKRAGVDKVNLAAFYNAILGGGQSIKHGNDSAGTGYFKEAIQMLYYTSYMGTLSDADRAAVEESAENGEWILRYQITVKSSESPYTFEFYRLDDRRVAVRLYRVRTDGTYSSVPTADFYMTTYAFKRFSSAYLALTRSEVIDPKDYGYGS